MADQLLAFDLSGVGGFPPPHWLKMTPTLVTVKVFDWGGSASTTDIRLIADDIQHGFMAAYDTDSHKNCGPDLLFGSFNV